MYLLDFLCSGLNAADDVGLFCRVTCQAFRVNKTSSRQNGNSSIASFRFPSKTLFSIV